MSIPIGILKAGKIEPVPYSAESLADAASKEPQGVYTAARTFNRNQALLLDDHLDRLERSAKLEGIAVTLDRAALRNALRTLSEKSGYGDSRFRITIPRDHPDEPILTLEEYHPVPQELIDNGVRVVLVRLARRNPEAKTTDWMLTRRAATEAFPKGVYEGILVTEDGELLEGTNTNFYAIRNDTLRTAGEYEVLSGIARRIVLTVATEILQVELKAIHTGEIPLISEAFLTSATRGVIPIVQIEDHQIGDGRPGNFTRHIRERYEAWATAHLEPI
jgi:branched-chain amino acid aminotransferase